MNSLSIYVAVSSDPYVVVNQESKADVVVRCHGDFSDRDEIQELLCRRSIASLRRGA